MVAALREHARYPVPPNVEQQILELAARYGRVVITGDGNFLRCACQDQLTTQRIARATEASPYLTHPISPTAFRVAREARGVLKQALVAVATPQQTLQATCRGSISIWGCVRARFRASHFKCATTNVRLRRHSISQEEAQRLGRVLRPKADGRAARFFATSRPTRGGPGSSSKPRSTARDTRGSCSGSRPSSGARRVGTRSSRWWRPRPASGRRCAGR